MSQNIITMDKKNKIKMDFCNKLNFLFNGFIIVGMIFMAVGFRFLVVEDKFGFIFLFGGIIVILENLLSKEILKEIFR